MSQGLQHVVGGWWQREPTPAQIPVEWPSVNRSIAPQFIAGPDLGTGFSISPGVAGPVFITPTDGVIPPPSDDTAEETPLLGNIWDRLRALGRRDGQYVAPSASGTGLWMTLAGFAIPGGLLLLAAWWIWRKAKR